MRFPRVSDFKNKIEPDGTKICRNCESSVAQGRRHYCSNQCMLTFNRNHDWYWIRKDILKRDNYRCSICKKRHRKAQLDIDHIIPARLNIDPFNKSNLRTLCKECHKAKTKLDRVFD
jgi:5-methylcytosine-specific restriction protein A